MYTKDDAENIFYRSNKIENNICRKGYFVIIKNDAILINTSRGGIVDENSLIKFLEVKRRKKV